MTAWERAVEAMRNVDCRLCHNRVPLDSTGDYHEHDDGDPEVCRARLRLIHEHLLAAAPHLERHFREKLAEELRQKATWLEDLNLAAVDKGRTEPDFALRKKHHEGVRFAADHLTRKEVP